MTRPVILFDLDGTLVDTAPDLVATLNVILGRENVPPVPYETARNLIGGGARKLLERGLAAEGIQVAPGKIEAMLADFLTYYAEHIADHSRPFDGLDAALDALATDGCRLAVCTNKYERLAVSLIERLGLTHRFETVCGPDTFGVAKPDPAVLRHVATRIGADLSQAVMVGDSGTDIAVARAAQIPVVAVDFGYTEIPVAELKPDRIISAMQELPAAVRALLSGPSGRRA